MKSIGCIRGDELQNRQNKWCDTLIKAKKDGMHFEFLSRSSYKLKKLPDNIHRIYSKNKIFELPEGGTNKLSLEGTAEIVEELTHQIDAPDYIVTACGTGGTVSGLINGVSDANWKTQIIGIPVLKGVEYLSHEIEKLTQQKGLKNWLLFHDYHFAGYAKSDQKLMCFSQQFQRDNNILLDKIYNAKSFYAVYDLINKGLIAEDSSVVILHTGGLQGGIFSSIK